MRRYADLLDVPAVRAGPWLRPQLPRMQRRGRGGHVRRLAVLDDLRVLRDLLQLQLPRLHARGGVLHRHAVHVQQLVRPDQLPDRRLHVGRRGPLHRHAAPVHLVHDVHDLQHARLQLRLVLHRHRHSVRVAHVVDHLPTAAGMQLRDRHGAVRRHPDALRPADAGPVLLRGRLFADAVTLRAVGCILGLRLRYPRERCAHGSSSG